MYSQAPSEHTRNGSNPYGPHRVTRSMSRQDTSSAQYDSRSLQTNARGRSYSRDRNLSERSYRQRSPPRSIFERLTAYFSTGQREIERACTKVENDSATLMAIIQRGKRELEEREATIETLKKEKDHLSRRLNSEAEKLQYANQRRTDFIRLKKENDRLVQTDLEKQTTIQYLRNTIESVKIERDRGEQAVRNMQAAALSHVEPSEWVPDEDSEVERQFTALNRQIHNWTKRNALKSLDALDGGIMGLLRKLRNTLTDFVVFDDAGFALGDLFGPSMASKAPQMILYAWINSLIYTHILNSPFFFFDELVNSDGVEGAHSVHPSSLRSILGVAERAFVECDPKAGSAWRAEFMKLLMPSDRLSDPEPQRKTKSQLRARTKNAISSHCVKLAVEFTQKAVDLLGRDDINSAYENLLTIFQDSADLSYKLWARKSDLQLVTSDKLMAGDFPTNMDYIKPHPLHNSLLDADSTALETKPVALVLSPAVIVCGKSNGTDYGSSRVWKKAEVFFDVHRSVGQQNNQLESGPDDIIGHANGQESEAPPEEVGKPVDEASQPQVRDAMEVDHIMMGAHIIQDVVPKDSLFARVFGNLEKISTPTVVAEDRDGTQSDVPQGSEVFEIKPEEYYNHMPKYEPKFDSQGDQNSVQVLLDRKPLAESHAMAYDDI